MSDCILLLGDQLFKGLPGLPQGVPILMQEDRALATNFRHHKQKVVLFFSAMRHCALELESKGRQIEYKEWNLEQPDLLERLRKTDGKIYTYTIHDRSFRALLTGALGDRLVEIPSPAFLTKDALWDSYAVGKTRKMGDFYKRQRRDLEILVDADLEPIGGQWSFDEDNRKKIPKGLTAPAMPLFPRDQITREVIDLVEIEFSDHPGNLEDFSWPVSRADALYALDQFLEQRFASFGPYEDAICQHQTFLWHSALSPLINMGLLTPSEVVKKALAFARENEVPMASLEGFVRQIIGWREFMKRIDEEYGETGRDESNHWNHDRRLNPCWWDATTGLPPVDAAIARCNRYGWCHHIERLMVLGATQLMAGIAPNESFRWFMEMFVDSAEWVMAPNVFGMSQMSDGGVFATKPYLSGSAYILKMSNYPAGPWTDIWDGLYWRFIHLHRDEFEKNPRMKTVTYGLDRLNSDRKDRIFSLAENWIDTVSSAANEG